MISIRLHQYTIKDKTLLPLIKEVIDKLKKVKYFNKLDLIWGYNNIQIKEGDKWKVAFITNKGLFKPKVIYFRLCNSSEMFQRMMNSIFRELLYKGVLVNYRQLCDNSQNQEGTRKKNNLILEDSRET